jgi:hypothetical protein
VTAAPACDPRGRAGWTLTPDPHGIGGKPGPSVHLALTDEAGFTARLQLDADALDNLHAGLDLVAILHPPSVLQTPGDRSQLGDYTLTVREADSVVLHVTRDGYRLGMAFTRAEIQALSAALTAVEAAAFPAP